MFLVFYFNLPMTSRYENQIASLGEQAPFPTKPSYRPLNRIHKVVHFAFAGQFYIMLDGVKYWFPHCILV